MARARTDRTRWIGVWALALVLLVQLVVSSAASAAAGAEPLRDAFGNVICSTATGLPDDPGGAPGHHSGLSDCCSFACSMVWPQLPPPEGLASFVLPVPGRASPQPLRAETLPSGIRFWRTADPRAPPAA